MKILCVAAVENDEFIREQIAKQTIQPDIVKIYIDENPAKGLDERRKRIADNHKILEQYVEQTDCDLVWQLEGDSELEDNTLERLIGHYIRLQNKDFGYISGIQVGRHGLYCLGAWIVKPDRTSFNSLDYKLTGIQQVDATGWYCLLAPRTVWLEGRANWNNQRYGPDVVWGLSLPYKKYVDMGLHIGHKLKRGTIRPSDMSTCNARFYLENNEWKFEQLD